MNVGGAAAGAAVRGPWPAAVVADDWIADASGQAGRVRAVLLLKRTNCRDARRDLVPRDPLAPGH